MANDFASNNLSDVPPTTLRSKVVGLQRQLRTITAVEWLAVGCLLFALAARFFARPHAPLWIDEAATGSILSQPDFGSFWREVYWEVSSPLYFLVMRPWEALFGLSNAALRAPSVIFSIAGPLCIAFSPVRGLSRADRLAWAALLALWIPGIGYAQDARCYALELLFATLQTLAFAELLRSTTLRNTTIWVAFAALATATHYDAAILAFAQGFLFLALKRWQAFRQWPAVLLITPVVALVLWQGPEMVRFMGADATWYKVLNGSGVFQYALYVLGNAWWIIALPILFLAALAFRIVRHPGSPAGIPSAFFWTAAVSVVAAAVLIGIATMKPILTARYLAPFAPGAMLLMIVWLRSVARQAGQLVLGGLMLSSVAMCALWLSLGAWHFDSVVEPLNYEAASEDLMKAGVHRVVFSWDNPNARTMHPEQIEAFGRFFFDRAEYPVEIIPVQLSPHEDPNNALVRAAAPSNAAILWIYDTDVTSTAAVAYPPSISQLDPHWQCRKTGEQFAVVTCIPDPRSH